MASMIRELLPDTVSAVEAFSDLSEAVLFPEEQALVARAVAKRRHEFATTRTLARRALSGLGLAPVAILRGKGGVPLWPAGVVGSMTHCTGYRCAVAAREGDVRSLGVDAEPNTPLPHGVLAVISNPAEREVLAELGGEPLDVAWDRLLFSAKESVYKALFPLTQRWPEFTDATVAPASDGTFRANLLVRAPVGRFLCRWLVRRDLILTVTVLVEQ